MPRIFLLQQHLQSWQQELELDSDTAALKPCGLGDSGSFAAGTSDDRRNLFWREKYSSSYLNDNDNAVQTTGFIDVTDSVEETLEDDTALNTAVAVDVIGKLCCFANLNAASSF
jgi:hypothetical protein